MAFSPRVRFGEVTSLPGHRAPGHLEHVPGISSSLQYTSLGPTHTSILMKQHNKQLMIVGVLISFEVMYDSKSLFFSDESDSVEVVDSLVLFCMCKLAISLL